MSKLLELKLSALVKIIEPLKELFKDEVRIVGKKLNISSLLLNRHPFPGPGLAIRIPGKIDLNKIKILQEVDHIYISYLKEKKLYNKIWQAFAVLLPVKSVGVMGDKRTYNYCVSLRAVTSLDGMTADFYMFDKKSLNEISSRIINNVEGVNRILYDFTTKQLESWGCKFDDLIVGYREDKPFQPTKPHFDLFIDDKAKRIEELE